MTVELLERDQVLATIMPGHGQPQPPGEAPASPEAEPDEEEVPGGTMPGGDGGA